MPPRLSDEDVGRQILGIFMRYRIAAGGTLRRNNFFDVRDADFQRGLNFAIASRWIKQHLRDRYTYQLTEIGYSAGWKPEPKLDDAKAPDMAAPQPSLQPEPGQPEAVTMAPDAPEPDGSERTSTSPSDPWKSPA